MKFKILILVFLFTCYTNGQENLCNTDILYHNEVLERNEIEKYSKYDFSSLWLKAENDLVYGIIGDQHQRILVKLIVIEKNLNNQNEYLVYGKSEINDYGNSVCEFVGKITIIKIQEFKNPNFGVDDMYKKEGIKNQGLLIAKYEFFEKKNQNKSGQFQGILKTIWYLDKGDVVRYNDIDINSDGYFNNSFVGTWKMNNSIIEKKCNWGDYRVPNSNCDFDIGVGEFSVSEKYQKNGWWIKPKQKWWE